MCIPRIDNIESQGSEIFVISGIFWSPLNQQPFGFLPHLAVWYFRSFCFISICITKLSLPHSWITHIFLKLFIHFSQKNSLTMSSPLFTAHNPLHVLCSPVTLTVPCSPRKRTSPKHGTTKYKNKRHKFSHKTQEKPTTYI